MRRARNIQSLIHWLEMGTGARWVRLGATLLGVLVLSLWVSWKQFHGVTSEATLVQADTGRQLARGDGFTTLVNYPQAVAYLAERGTRFDANAPYPELYYAPLYSVVIAGGLRLMPAGVREGLFAKAPVPPDGFGGDYFLLGLNVVMFWAVAWLTFDLGRRLFDARTGWVAMLATVLSVGAWQQVVGVNGAGLLMLLATGAFWIWARIEAGFQTADALGKSREEDGTGEPAAGAVSGKRIQGGVTQGPWLVALGGVCGLLFLAEYSAGALVLVALGYAARRFPRRRRALAVVGVAVGFAIAAGPWMVRNIVVSGTPTALAVQNVALKAGDPTAEPAAQRNLLSAELPAIDLRKLGNKTLTSLQENLEARVWSGGAMWLAAFFVAGWLYAFRSEGTNRLRWVFTAALGVLLAVQSAFNSGESERLAAGWLAPLIIVFGTGFFFVLLGSNARLGQWPRLCATVLLIVQALPLVRDALEPRRLHFQYPPYFPSLFMGMKHELERRDRAGRFGVMADVPAGVAWYGGQRVWSQPVKLRDFYAITLEQPMGELLLTPRTLDRPFFSELAARPLEPDSLAQATNRFGEWGTIYAGLFTRAFPAEFPLRVPQKLADNLYLMLNPALPPAGGK